MDGPDTPQGATYVLWTRLGTERYVASTVEKYYGELLASVSRNPGGSDGVVVCATTHELPADAFRRIVEVDRVAQFDRTDAALQHAARRTSADGQ